MCLIVCFSDLFFPKLEVSMSQRPVILLTSRGWRMNFVCLLLLVNFFLPSCFATCGCYGWPEWLIRVVAPPLLTLFSNCFLWQLIFLQTLNPHWKYLIHVLFRESQNHNRMCFWPFSEPFLYLLFQPVFLYKVFFSSSPYPLNWFSTMKPNQFAWENVKNLS